MVLARLLEVEVEVNYPQEPRQALVVVLVVAIVVLITEMPTLFGEERLGEEQPTQLQPFRVDQQYLVLEVEVEETVAALLVV